LETKNHIQNYNDKDLAKSDKNGTGNNGRSNNGTGNNDTNGKVGKLSTFSILGFRVRVGLAWNGGVKIWGWGFEFGVWKNLALLSFLPTFPFVPLLPVSLLSKIR